MKKFVAVTLLSLVAMKSVAAPLGMAEAGSNYRLVRQQDSLLVEPKNPVSLNSNDQIVADAANVRVRMLNGDLLVVGQKASATMLDANQAQVHNGQVLVSSKTGSQTSLVFEDLTIRALPSDGKATTYAVNAFDKNTISIANYSETMLTVTNKAGEQLALVTNQDVLTFTRSQAGNWAVTSVPMLALQGQEVFGDDPSSTPPTEEDDGDRDEAIAWWWIPVGAAAVGGAALGTYLLIEEEEDIVGDNIRETFGDDDDGGDDDDEGDDRGSQTP